jgi:hypothetical protein
LLTHTHRATNHPMKAFQKWGGRRRTGVLIWSMGKEFFLTDFYDARSAWVGEDLKRTADDTSCYWSACGWRPHSDLLAKAVKKVRREKIENPGTYWSMRGGLLLSGLTCHCKDAQHGHVLVSASLIYWTLVFMFHVQASPQGH